MERNTKEMEQMNVPVLDLKRQYETVKDDVDAAIREVVESQYFILGPKVEALEQEIAAYCGTKYAVGVASGSEALLVSLMALGVGPGDEVITTSFSFFATAGCIARLGAKIVFVDVDPATLNISPEQVAEKITDKTKAVLPVHLYGQCADMDPIVAAAKEKNIPVVEDAAQAIGAEYKGKRAGSLGDIGCFSFYPTKNLSAYGDGGMVTTSDEELAEKIRLLRAHGAKPKYYHAVVGLNARLDALQAAVLSAKMKYLDGWNERRREIAALYNEKIKADGVVLPVEAEYNKHVYHQYVIRVPDRDGLAAKLKDAGVGTMIYYPVPLHLQECFAGLGYREGDLPVSEQAAKEVLALPIFPELTRDEIEYVADCINKFVSAG